MPVAILVNFDVLVSFNLNEIWRLNNYAARHTALRTEPCAARSYLTVTPPSPRFPRRRSHICIRRGLVLGRKVHTILLDFEVDSFVSDRRSQLKCRRACTEVLNAWAGTERCRGRLTTIYSTERGFFRLKTSHSDQGRDHAREEDRATVGAAKLIYSKVTLLESLNATPMRSSTFRAIIEAKTRLC